jgi:cyclophilin family peptidyl-prolyl cis-trans isomerase
LSSHLKHAATGDGAAVVFGAVVEGMGVLKRMEAVGSKSGVVARRVTISNCGQLESKLQRALKVAAERAENEEYMNDPLKVDVDGEAAARLKRLRGEEPSKSEDPGHAGMRRHLKCRT